MRKALALGAITLSAVALAATATPAQAVDSITPTTVTFTVATGTLAITTAGVATGVAQGLTGSAAEITASLGLTTITDTRVAGGAWTASANASDFTVVAPATGNTIAASAARYYVPATPIAALGGHTFTVAASTAAGAVANGAALVTDVGAGVNTATFLPSIKITLPANTTTAQYTGTVTQSVV